jgi:hypothetical protein
VLLSLHSGVARLGVPVSLLPVVFDQPLRQRYLIIVVGPKGQHWRCFFRTPHSSLYRGRVRFFTTLVVIDAESVRPYTWSENVIDVEI